VPSGEHSTYDGDVKMPCLESVCASSFFVGALCLLGCSNPTGPSSTATGAGGGTTSSIATTSTGTGGEGGTGDPTMSTLETIAGDVTWTVTFDATATAAGATDCTYTRHYEGVEDASAPWLCPSCEKLFRADVTMPSGQADCFSQVSSTAPDAHEWIGYANGTWFRSAGITATPQGTATIDGTHVATTNTVPDLMAPAGGTMSFGVAGQLTLATTIGDPMNGFRPPAMYACGWPKSSAPAYTGDYTVVAGQTVPDGLFKDACGETVRLHDLSGAYLLVDMAAVNCGPCQNMASQEEAFVADMAAQGITVRVVTLLAPSLEKPLDPTAKGTLKAWISNFDLTSPVLGDRGWGLSMFLAAVGDSAGYPSWVLVDPNLKVMNFGTGFGTFDEHKTAILADQP
jgi:hypothetical protein